MICISILLSVLVYISCAIGITNMISKLIIFTKSKQLRGNAKSESTLRYAGYIPRVAIHLAICNENPEVVLQTLDSLNKIDYSNFIVMVVDNNTNDRALWCPIKEYCLEHKELFVFHHIENMKGFKSGALNYAIENTPEDVEIVAIVDSDNIVDKGFLQECIPFFKNDDIAFVQTPLGYTITKNNPFDSWVNLYYQYFMYTYMPYADKYNCPLFTGCMGLIRVSALKQVGGWNGKYLTEDMEVSYRLFANGFKSKFVNKVYGHSNLPFDFYGFRKQNFRWSFGNAQVLRDYFFSFFCKKWSTKCSVLSKFIYAAGVAIYTNYFYFAIILLLALNSFSSYFFLTNYSFFLNATILLAYLLEFIGELYILSSIGIERKASKRDICRNFLSWWSLRINHCAANYLALFTNKIKFNVTSKVRSKEKIPRYYIGITIITTLVLIGLSVISIIQNHYNMFITCLVISLSSLFSTFAAVRMSLMRSNQVSE